MKIYNSLTRRKEEFIPLKPNKIGMYVCGPTVYDEPHIGHARSAYIFDVIRRYLAYRDYKVTFVRNVTDVDDKIINKAKLAQSPCPPPAGELTAQSLKSLTEEVARTYLDAYHEDMETLGIRPPDEEPKATGYVAKMVKFIERLIKNGCAYASGGDVYFDIKKAKDYGKLSNQSADKMEAGSRIAPGEKKRDPLDFALWKAAKEGEPSWPSPWGDGRPGWHIECSVMSSDILGGQFDIHGGGIDLIFPHHENEIAQSEGAGEKFARCWIHNGLLTINSEKMAKSLGNFITIKDFIKKYQDPDFLKLFFLSGHYSSPIDFTHEKIVETSKEKERVDIFLRYSKSTLEKFERVYNEKPKIDYMEHFKTSLHDLVTYKENFEKAMDDDFNMPQAMAEIFNIVHYGNSIKMSFADRDNDLVRYVKIKYAKDLVSEYISNVFGLCSTLRDVALQPVEELLIKEREEARKKKDFKKADEFRTILLNDHRIILEDTKDGTTWRRKI